ncbi:hypothetical protein ABFS82_04G002500 [Erythranthe guttata]|uniref:Dipeptidylpeptidase IV N-terminal domain-containing protein n=1 Tax=Erythranthe guttata TaxID=4155 RepID=A0A022S4I8_ERYGU|nr:PREDICTED: uncharacterized protein LOC105955539 [Erythranthe guttata]EYU46868.1 hypothetical protein MIMGU_mgv1a002606mg [Erythranthe guttata]|eukprot:XP_012834739.1 PREDICTED: uncharacterized protein LOC105955539 [Erythranthe guttata]
MEPTGTIVFTSVGRPDYGFDVYSVHLPSNSLSHWNFTEQRLTDCASVNFNGQFVDDDSTLVFISERTGSARIFLNRPGNAAPEQLHSPPESLFHDRPFIKNGRLYFISAHQQPDKPFKSWTALYSTGGLLDVNKAVVRLTPYGSVDYSPAISQSGNLIAVASYGPRSWGGEFHHLLTDIVVFPDSDPSERVLVCSHGGWPTWCGDSTIYFHRQADDGWWSIFRVDFDYSSTASLAPTRVTPPGVHCFTPAAMHNNSNRIAVATRRKGNNYRHIEIFDIDSMKFHPVTEPVNPNFHHYNPFVSPESTLIGYHRFRGEGAAAPGDSTIPHLEPIISPIQGLRMLRLNGSFPAFSPCGNLIAFNHDFDLKAGLKIVKSDGSKRWTLFENRTTFYNSWSPADKNVIFTSIGGIFQSARAAVQIARVTFDPSHMSDDRDEIPVEIKILTKEETGNNAFPCCSPDGKSVVFRSGRSGHKNLYIMDAVNGELEGGMVRQLTDGNWIDTMPSWSPDGKLIAFSSNRHNPENEGAFGIYLVEPNGKGVRRVQVAVIEEERERLNHVCFSADGEWLLFTSNLGGVTAEPVSIPNQFQPYGDMYLVRLDGSGLQRLTWNGYENGTPAWHPTPGLSLSALSLEGNKDGEDKLKGQFDEPLWILCDL